MNTESSERDITFEDYLVECEFARQDGRPIYPRTLTENFNRATKEAALPKIRIHYCRHTHATLLLEAGVSLKEVQERFGHSSIKMTGDIYVHVTLKIKARTAKNSVII
uniref:site-specific integrase n=1 Tax=Bacillus maqinnsis TaxID=3229854 RepID=UPI003EB6B6AD